MGTLPKMCPPIRAAFRLCTLVMTLALIVLNLRLYHAVAADDSPDTLGDDVVPQLQFIGDALRQGAGEEMQEWFPEGYFFAHVLYGLSWVEVGLLQPRGSPMHERALSEARWALARLDSPQGRAPFSPTLDPSYGVFYVGWSNWLRGGILKLQDLFGREPSEVERFKADCAALAEAFDRNSLPFLQAYPGQAWPVDSTVAVATLRLHDSLFTPRFTQTIDHWLSAIPDYLDPTTGLLPHQVDPRTGNEIEGARGTSQSLITRFLTEIDPELGYQHYAHFRQALISPFLGVPGVREHPSGRGVGDVDSGPLIFGFSASATVNLIGTARVNGDHEVAAVLISASEAVGLPIDWREGKRYAFGLLPVGDAFLVWNKASHPWVAKAQVHEYPSIVSRWWRWPFHAVTLGLIVVMGWPGRRRC